MRKELEKVQRRTVEKMESRLLKQIGNSVLDERETRLLRFNIFQELLENMEKTDACKDLENKILEKLSNLIWLLKVD